MTLNKSDHTNLDVFTLRGSEALRPRGVQPAEGAVDGHSSTVSTGIASAQVGNFLKL